MTDEKAYDFVFADGEKLRLHGFPHPPMPLLTLLIKPIRGCSTSAAYKIGNAWRQEELWRPEKEARLTALARAFSISVETIFDAFRLGAPARVEVHFRCVDMADGKLRWVEYHEVEE